MLMEKEEKMDSVTNCYQENYAWTKQKAKETENITTIYHKLGAEEYNHWIWKHNKGSVTDLIKQKKNETT